jgi:hypothetical protein
MFKRAIDLYTGIISESNNSDDSITQYLVHHNLGLCYRSTREFNNAIYHFKKAIALKPYRPQSWADMGETYYYAGDYFQGHKFQDWKYSDLTQEKRLDWDDPYVRCAVLTRADGQYPDILFPSDDELVEIYKNTLGKVKGAIINVRADQGLDDVVYASYFVKELLKYEPKKIILSARLEVLRLFYDLDEKIIVQDEIPDAQEYDYFVPSTALPKLMLDTSSAKKPVPLSVTSTVSLVILTVIVSENLKFVLIATSTELSMISLMILINPGTYCTSRRWIFPSS